MFRTRHALFSFLCLLAVLLAVPVTLTWRQVRQERLNRALMAAVKRYDAQAVLSLLQQGADANTRDLPEQQPSFWRVLLDRLHGRSVKSPMTPTALAWALTNVFGQHPHRFTASQKAVLQALVAHGAQVNDWVEGCNPLLSYAAGLNDAALVEAMLDHGANANAINAYLGGYPALLWTDDVATVRVLLAHGAKVNARSDLRGWTPLMWFAGGGARRVRIVKVLLEHGADVSVRDEDGYTALRLAKDDHNAAVVRLLQQAGAKP